MNRRSPFDAVFAISLELAVALSIAWVGFLPSPARGDDSPAEKSGQTWAVLIGAEKYHRANQLKYITNDVREIGQTLRRRGGLDEDHILEMSDEATNPRFQPLRTSIMSELPARLKLPQRQDALIVYFSGHGFKDTGGKLYIAPLDCDPADPAATGIPVEWLREQIAKCPAEFKLLVLDACHAGTEKGNDDGPASGVAAKDLSDEFRRQDSIVTIASSDSNEKSQIWDDKKQSLFSYWLNQGLKGHADENSDGTVDIDELYKFVSRNVTQTAKARFPRAQSPVRVVRVGTKDVPVVVRLQPQSLRELLSDIADQLADNVANRKLNRVGVLEFTNDTRLGEFLGGDFGLLGRYCSEDLERKLTDASTGRFNVVDRKRLQKALKDEGFKIDDLESTPRLKSLSSRTGGMPAVAVGTLRSRSGRLITLQCKLLSIDNEESLGGAGGTAQLNESEWAMIGRSVELKPEDRTPEIPANPGRVPAMTVSTADTVIKRADERSRGSHPLNPKRKNAFDFPIKIMINNKERPFVFKTVGTGEDQHEECILPVHMGEVYEIWIGNRTGDVAAMRLLVDGLNTMTEKEKEVTEEGKDKTEKGKDKSVQTIVWGKRVNLDDAHAWILNPNESTLVNGIPTTAVRGFATATGEKGEVREFTISDVQDSLAARQQFTDQVGLITAAFYEAVYENGTRSGPAATKAGKARQESIGKSDAKPGDLISVVHIRYMDADSVDTVK